MSSAGGHRSLDPLLGRVVSHYRVVERLGGGGMGAVYVAEDEALGRRVAIKAIRHDLRDSQRLRERFQREARLLSRLDHPNICRVHDYVSGEDEDFLVLELIQGRTLARHAESGLEHAEALRVASGITAALVAAHGQAIVHRDLKPANVMVTDEGVVKVLDFGLARPTRAPEEVDEPAASSAPAHSEPSSWSSVEATLTEAGAVTGTLRYMSPEQARAEPLTTASDVYSLGLILQELVSGERAYPAGLTPVELWELVKLGRTVPFASRDGELRRLLAGMQAPVASERPTALDVAHALARLRGRTRRRLLQLAAAATLVLIAGGITKYVLDLGRERQLALEAADEADRERRDAVAARGEAEAARREAEQRRDQAEELLGFVLGDLRDELKSIGRLDVLDDVGQQVRRYFDALPEELISDRERVQRSKMLYQLGMVREDQGDLAGARALYEQSHAAVAGLTEQDPDNLEWLFALGQAQFYVGAGLFEQGDLAGAREWFERYMDTASQGLRLSGDQRLWRQEHAYAVHNLGVLDHRRGDSGAALERFEEAADVWRALLEETPEDPDLWLELADVLSFLGSVRLELAASAEDADQVAAWRTEARADFETERALRDRLLERAPDDPHVKSQLATAELYSAKCEQGLGRDEAALERYERALELAAEVCGHDPANTEWQAELARIRVLAGRLLVELGRPERARDLFAEAIEGWRALVALDPARGAWRAELERTERDAAELAEPTGPESARSDGTPGEE